VEVVVEDLLAVKEVGMLTIEKEEAFEYFLELAAQLTRPKLFSQVQDRIGMMVVDVVEEVLGGRLQEALITPCYQALAK
jgi:flagellar biosynthesis/type III secretory pathway protein FliH